MPQETTSLARSFYSDALVPTHEQPAADQFQSFPSNHKHARNSDVRGKKSKRCGKQAQQSFLRLAFMTDEHHDSCFRDTALTWPYQKSPETEKIK